MRIDGSDGITRAEHNTTRRDWFLYGALHGARREGSLQGPNAVARRYSSPMNAEHTSQASESSRSGHDRGQLLHSALAGLVASVPIPFLDAKLLAAMRGSTLRRIARHHHVSLSPEALKTLSTPSSLQARGRLARHAARWLIPRVGLPTAIASRVEAIYSTMILGILVERFLQSRRASLPAEITIEEALQLRTAIDAALSKGAFDAILGAPREVAAVWKESGHEDAPFWEQFIDRSLSAIVDAPIRSFDQIYRAFDEALAAGGHP